MRLKVEPLLEAKHQAFDFQLQAVDTLSQLEYGAVFHEQGLGKTKIALDVVVNWLVSEFVDTALIIAKKSLINNWCDEISTHTFLVPKILSQDTRANFFAFNSPTRLMLAHYEVVPKELERLKLFCASRNVGVILDEAHKIKNPEAGVTKSFLELSPYFHRRIIMTGTPVANRPYDVWSQIKFLDGGKSLGNDFKKFKKGMDFSPELAESESAQAEFEHNLENFFSRVSTFSIRETKKSGVLSLPEKQVQNVYSEWEPRQFDLYQQVKNELRAVVIRDGIPTEDNAEALLKRLLRLVQIASYPKLIDDSYTNIPGKVNVLRSLVETICDQGEKSIVWTSFQESTEYLTRELSDFGAVCVHGGITPDERHGSINDFKEDGEVRVLVATPGAAKEGLTLTVANHAIFYDRTFSLDDYLQAQDRIHRISQEKECHIYNIIMSDSIDAWVEELLFSKQLAAQLAQGDIEIKEFRELISYEYSRLLKEILGIDDGGGGDDG